MAVRYEFACQDGHEFAIWSDAPRCCPECGSEYLKRIFTTPPAVNTPKTKILDNVIRSQLEAHGITNIQGGGHEGDQEKVTWKTAPEQLKADKILKDFPAANDKKTIAELDRALKNRWGSMGVKGVIGAGVPTNDFVKQMIPVGTRFKNGKLEAVAPASPNQFKLHDRQLVKRVHHKDPDNLQVKKNA